MVFDFYRVGDGGEMILMLSSDLVMIGEKVESIIYISSTMSPVRILAIILELNGKRGIDTISSILMDCCL